MIWVKHFTMDRPMVSSFTSDFITRFKKWRKVSGTQPTLDTSSVDGNVSVDRFRLCRISLLINLEAVSIIRFVSSSAFRHLIIRPLMTYNPTRCICKTYNVPTRYFNKEYIVFVSFLEPL